VSVVRQNPFIFNDTLRHNLTVGNREATPEEIDRMCRIAKVDEFIDDLPAGYDTVLGDNGSIVESGEHGSLVAHDGTYADLYESQSYTV
jgi:subfamily B ATP-binding cassette protein MsbA